MPGFVVVELPETGQVTLTREQSLTVEELRGVILDDDPEPVRAAAAQLATPTLLRLTLTQGKYHQVKRMVAAVGNRVEALHRSAFGALTLDTLPEPGQWRWIGGPERERAFAAPA